MVQEERNPKCSISSYGGSVGGIRTRSSKRQKQKKAPQRGLGVAQLEKIRIEEQQNYASVAAVSTITPPQDSDPDVSVPAKGTVPLANALKYGGLEDANQYGTAYSNRNDHEAWNFCEHIAEDGRGIDPRITFHSKLPLPSKSDYPWPLSGFPQYDPPPPSSMVNASTTSSSFVLNSETEPPSNQSYHGNCTPVQQEEEKISGLKRPCPFSSEKLPVLPVHLKLLTSANTLQRSDNSASSDYAAQLVYELETGSFRYSSFEASVSNAKSIQSKKQNGVFSNEFLTLGLPTLPSAWPSTKSKQPFASVAFSSCEPPDNEIPCCLGRAQDSKSQKGSRWVNQRGNYDYHSFLPPAKMRSNEGAASMTTFCSGVADGSVDLDLKL